MCVSADEAEGGGDVGDSDIEKVDISLCVHDSPKVN
jgi:hypothetical protein